MEYLELGEVFKINIDNKIVYLKVEPDNLLYGGCKNCYFNKKGIDCTTNSSCTNIEREDKINVIYREINPIQNVFIIFGQRRDGFVKQCGVYPNEEDAKKKVEELNRYYFDFAHYYRTIQYYPYGIINDIKEVKIN